MGIVLFNIYFTIIPCRSGCPHPDINMDEIETFFFAKTKSRDEGNPTYKNTPSSDGFMIILEIKLV